ncbi:MAG: ABC transporter, partial [Thermoleophilia bacterium]
MAVARVEDLSFSYPGRGEALRDVTFVLQPGQVVLLAGRSGSGKTTLLRALSGLVPHFHGGRFSGRVEVGGLDTRRARPADLAGTVGILFQDPEDQVVLGRVLAEVAFGLENVGRSPAEIERLAQASLARIGASHLALRATGELSGGELQRVCLAATLALDPALLLLDEPCSQLDREGQASLLVLLRRLARQRGTAVVVAEHRLSSLIPLADRVLVLEDGALVLDAPRDEAEAWIAAHRPGWLSLERERGEREPPGDLVLRLEGIYFSYPGRPVLEGVSLEARRGEIVALTGPNGSGKTTLAKIAAGLLEPEAGTVARRGRASYLCQDPGRYLVCERAEDEVALGASDRAQARRALLALGLGHLAHSHPRDLSSGERERLALAAVLATDPDLLVLDEPTRGLDRERARELASLLRCQAPGRATLLVTHDAEL